MIQGLRRAIDILEEEIKNGVPSDEEAVLEDLIDKFKDEIMKYIRNGFIKGGNYDGNE